MCVCACVRVMGVCMCEGDECVYVHVCMCMCEGDGCARVRLMCEGGGCEECVRVMSVHMHV